MMEFLKTILLKNQRLVSRVYPSRHRAYSFRGGRIFLDVTESKMMLARALGRYEVSKHDAMEALLKPGQVFIDVGVNKGDFTLLAAKLVGVDGAVLACEPEPENCKWIRRSIDLNGYENVRLFELALSDESGEAPLFIGEKSGWHTLLPNQNNAGRGAVTVRTRTLDSLLAEIGFARPIDIMKIDVEGAEINVLHGARETLTASRDLILLLDIHPHLGVDPLKVRTLLNELGFSIYQDTPPLFSRPADVTKHKSVMARR
jgi:FkbM family methyltransferase